MSRNNQLLILGFLLVAASLSTEINEQLASIKLSAPIGCNPCESVSDCSQYGDPPQGYHYECLYGCCYTFPDTEPTPTPTPTTTTTTATTSTYTTTYTSDGTTYTVTTTTTYNGNGTPFDEPGFGRAVIMVVGLITMMYALLRRR